MELILVQVNGVSGTVRLTLKPLTSFPPLPLLMVKVVRPAGVIRKQAAGDWARAEAWFNRYDKMPPELASVLAPSRPARAPGSRLTRAAVKSD